jgi:thiosulfate/3-mercaptopyruvate sulfurtransferase
VSAQADIDVIEPEALTARLANKSMDDKLLLVQVTSAQVYEQAHIAGAVLVTPQALVCGVAPATGKLPEKPALDQLFSSIGYRGDEHIVVYDDEGGGWAGRFAWTLDVIGHRGWTYLNGGLHAWHHAGLPLEQGAYGGVTSSAVDVRIDTSPIAEIADVLAAIEDPQQVIWDVRSAEEYAGQRQASARLGHIPGAINLDWLLLQDPERQTRLVAGIEDRLQTLGISGKGGVITHCQTHHRSGLSYMLGRLLGMDIRAYHGSWSEWGNREDTPIELD